MYLNLFISVGEKRLPPTPLHLGVRTIHQLTDQSFTWLIDCYWWVGVNDLDRSRSQMPAVFTGLRNYRCQNQFIIPFNHRAGGRVTILNLSWIQLVCRFPVCPAAAYFFHLFYTKCSCLSFSHTTLPGQALKLGELVYSSLCQADIFNKGQTLFWRKEHGKGPRFLEKATAAIALWPSTWNICLCS